MKKLLFNGAFSKLPLYHGGLSSVHTFPYSAWQTTMNSNKVITNRLNWNNNHYVINNFTEDNTNIDWKVNDLWSCCIPESLFPTKKKLNFEHYSHSRDPRFYFHCTTINKSLFKKTRNKSLLDALNELGIDNISNLMLVHLFVNCDEIVLSYFYGTGYSKINMPW
jgi:hypothetical protein